MLTPTAMPTATARAIDLFVSLLDERLSTGVFTTEDSVRYTFFHALLRTEVCQHTDVILEAPHPTLQRAEIDTLIIGSANLPSTALEFKYHRMIPSGASQPRPMKAGGVFNDIFRLARIPDQIAKKRYLVYLTDSEMASYLRNPRNGLDAFFGLGGGQSLALTSDFFSARPKTFQKEVRNSQTECTVVGLVKRQLSKEHALRIFEIRT